MIVHLRRGPGARPEPEPPPPVREPDLEEPAVFEESPGEINNPPPDWDKDRP